MNTILQKNIIPHNKPTIGCEEIEAVVDALSNLELTIGIKVREFENMFMDYMGINSTATSSGTSALHLALIAIGVSKKDEVIIPSYTCMTVAFPVLYQQAKPILADVNDNYNISLKEIKDKITDNTKAIIVPHMFGYPADIKEIKDICEEKDICLVEDCAQSIGALYDGKKVGTFGDISIFSFYATKMITTIQGGMVCTNNPNWRQTIEDLRFHDQCRSFEDPDLRLKYNYRMPDVSAAMGMVQLKKLNDFIKRRREIAQIYRENITNAVMHPLESNNKKHVYSRYVVKSPDSSFSIIDKMREHNIICEVMHMPPLNRRALLKKYNVNVKYPKTEEIRDYTISLPIYPSLENEDALYIANTFNKIMGEIR